MVLQPDLLVIGGGIAGLWSLLRARAAGYSALLLESSALGGGQTVAAQGIIHGGTKYALGGRLSRAARAIGEMPARWRACLEGRGELDLTRVPLLSPHQYLWGDGGLTAALAGFFGSRAMRSRVAPVARGEGPPPFDAPAFRGVLYRLDEPVLNLPALIAELARQGEGACGRCPAQALRLSEGRVEADGVILRPRRLLLAAGAGNAALLDALGIDDLPMQRRPLHMVMVRGRLPAVYAHALGAGRNPRLTITSHFDARGETVWYLGGQLAERGVERTTEEQLAVARRELEALLPWMAFDGLSWAAFRIDRAEAATPDGRRPDDLFFARRGAVMVTWPTKLAFAPRVADRVLDTLSELEPTGGDARLPLPPPPPAAPPWEECVWS